MMKLVSMAFGDGDLIPMEYTCDGAETPPPLSWSGAPEETVTYVLIMHDPDAPMGDWDHWVVYNIPGHINAICHDGERLPRGSELALNSWDHEAYGGPCPPDAMHRYVFQIYALDTTLNLPRRSDRDDVENAMRGHILGQASLMGKYERQ